MNWVRSLWISIKRNPVINAVLAAVAIQIAQDYLAGRIDTQHIAGYLFTVGVGVIARHFTMPVKEHDMFVRNRNEDLANAYNRGIIDGGSE
jgi:hypothetical protein